MKSRLLKSWTLAMMLGGQVLADEIPDGHFSSWEDVPKIIESITADNYHQPLQQLHQLTQITLGTPLQTSDAKKQETHVIRTKEAWQKWWKTTGKTVRIAKKQDARIDLAAFSMAWDFFGTDLPKPKKILPVWIPQTWTLNMTFTNGDYGGSEKEVWIIQRQEKRVNMLKLRGDYSRGKWGVSLARNDEFTVQQADKTLKALYYLHQYAPSNPQDVSDDEMKTYYPGATLRLHTGKDQLLWNTKGYNFKKTRDEYGRGEPERSYYFLNSTYQANSGSWKKLAQPTGGDLAPYRDLLSKKKPYFFSNASDIILLFAKYGQVAELRSMFAWAAKQKSAIDPKMDWKVHSDEFGHALKVNVINFTRLEFQETVKAIKQVAQRLKLDDSTVKKIKALEQDVTDMLALEKKEKEDDINRHPQPLRDLIRADRHPHDSDLTHLKAAIERIREKPDPKLFKQLAAELDDGTVLMRSLLENILLDKGNSLKMAAWKPKQKSTAIHACIEALPIAQKIGELEDLVTVILKASGGGEIEIVDGDGSRRIEVVLTKNGYSLTYGGADNPLSISDAQKKLRKIYAESRQR